MSRGLHTEEEKAKIRASKQATALRHSSMDMKVYELKIVERRLNRQQKEALDLLFLEGKWLYNHILSEKKKMEVPLNCINPTGFKDVLRRDKDGNETSYKLQVLPSHFK